MPLSHDPLPAGFEPLDGDVIELEPAVAPETGRSGGTRTGAPIALVEGSMASLASELNVLRRGRLGSAALFLAAVYGFLFLWSLFNRGDAHWTLSLLMALRFACAAGALGVLFGRWTLTPGQLRAVEYFLFGSLTILVAVGQYVIALHFIRRGDMLDMVAYQKNVVIQLFMLMILYGMFVPNDAKTVARVVLSMALAPLIAVAFLLERPEVAHAARFLRSPEQAGSNVLILLIGAALAIYGAHVLNGLRVQLHEASRFGQYHLRRKIGAGGMGEVYLAEHQLLKRPCALKLIRPDTLANPTALARFEREVRSAARLSHPNTIEIYDYGHSDDGTFYYVMEYLPGLSLGDLVRQYGPLPPGRLIYLLRQACAGLAEAHALGLIHRDLKPANIFVARRGGESDVAKVLDFGLVKLTRDPDLPELTTDQTVSGTPAFMSPEQASGERNFDARADIYALGAIAYHALTGRPPFTGESAMAVMIAHARDPVVPPSQLRPDIPSDLEQVVLRCLAKRPEGRYPDVKELAKALSACSTASDWDAERAEQWWSEATRAVEAPAGP